MRRGERLELGSDLDRLPVALVAFGRDVTLGDDPLGLARLLEGAAPLGQGDLGLGPSVARARQGVAVALELGQRQLTLVECRLRLGDGLLGDLEAARVPVATRAQVVERPVELLARPAGAPVGAADRGLQAVAQRAVVA